MRRDRKDMKDVDVLMYLFELLDYSFSADPSLSHYHQSSLTTNATPFELFAYVYKSVSKQCIKIREIYK